MAHKTNKKVKVTHKKLNLVAYLFILLAFLYLLVFIFYKIKLYDETSNIAANEPIRELILQGVNVNKQPAPVDFRTGDIYFPEAKLFLPRPNSPVRLNYGWIDNDRSNHPLTISNDSTNSHVSQSLISARNIDELFEAVPKLQACHRGVQLAYNPPEDNMILKQEITLESGKKLYISIEKECPELEETTRLLAGIKEY